MTQNNKDYIKRLNFWIGTLLTIAIVSFTFIIFFMFIYPAYSSYMDSKGESGFLDKYLMGDVGGYYIPGNDTIVIFSNSSLVLRHEICHRNQGNTPDSFIQELECYIKQYFFWEKVNFTTLNYEKTN